MAIKEETDGDPLATRTLLATSPKTDVEIAVTDPESGSGRLEVRCPNCHTPMEVAVDTQLTDLTCRSCGSQFSLVDDKAASQLAPSLAKLGRFELIARLGMGAFGSVWKARDIELDRTVAIKIPRAGGMTAEEQEKFFREARAAAQLKHPSIVSVHEVGREGESVYIVSDFVCGVTLGDWLTSQQLTNREAAELCAIIADALHHAHEQGVVHRDLKPANIMIDGDGQPHIMDFGLARREVGEVTVTMDGQILGTPAYMSPEQAQGESHMADRRSDLYSLGVILFQLLTTELPFRGNARMLMHQVIHDEPPSPRKLNANISKDLETITLKCLEKQPARRYQTARELVFELRRFLADEPIHARPIGRLARARRWAKRRPAAAALLAVIAGVAVVGPAIAIQQIVLRHQRDTLLTERTHALTQLAKNNVEIQHQLVRSLISRGSAQCVSGSISQGIALFAHAWKIAPADDPLRWSARNLLAGWSSNVCVGNPLVHDDIVTVADFSPDGRTALTVSHDGTARLWDPVRGKPVGEPMVHPNVFEGSYSHDGSTVITRSGDNEIRLWSSVDAKPLADPIKLKGFLRDVAFSPDGRTVLTGDYDKTARLWDARTGMPVGEPMQHEASVDTVAFSPDSRTVCTGSDKLARLWDTSTGNAVGKPMEHDDHVGEVEFSSNGKFVVALYSVKAKQGPVMGNNTARLWDAATQTPVGRPIQHDDYISSVAFSPDAKTIVTGSADNTARLWDCATGNAVGQPMHHSERVEAVAFSPDGHTVATAGHDFTVRMWDAATGKPLGEPRRHDNDAWRVAFSHDGRLLLTASTDNTARLWKVSAEKPLGDAVAQMQSFAAVVFSPDRRRILFGGGRYYAYQNSARFRDIATGKEVGEWMAHDKPSGTRLSALAYGTDGRIVVSGGEDKTARLWNAETGNPLGDPLRHDDAVSAVAISPDGRTVLTGSGNVARLWESATGKSVGAPIRHDTEVSAVTFSPDGRTILTGSGKLARRWKTDTGERVGEPMRHNKLVVHVAFSPDGATILTATGTTKFAGTGELAHLWDAATGQAVGEDMPHINGMSSATFSPDRRLILTGDGFTAQLWDAATVIPVGKPMHFDHFVAAIAFNPDGRTFLATSGVVTSQRTIPQLPDDSNLIRNWAAVKSRSIVERNELVRQLSQSEWLKARDELEKLSGNEQLP